MNNELTSRKKLPFIAEKDSAAFQHEIILALIKDVDARTKDIPLRFSEIVRMEERKRTS
jgi:hypothetical protein